MSNSGSTRFSISALGVPAISSGSATLPNAVRDDSRLKCWNTMPIERRAVRRSRSDSAVISTPLTTTRPLDGLSRPLISRISVDLPAPLRPITPRIEPFGTVRLMSSRATTSALLFRAGYTLRTRSIRIPVVGCDDTKAGRSPAGGCQGAFIMGSFIDSRWPPAWRRSLSTTGRPPASQCLENKNNAAVALTANRDQDLTRKRQTGENSFAGARPQIPPPSSKASYRALAWVMTLFGGTSRVSQTPPPIDEPCPIVTRPSTVAPA